MIYRKFTNVFLSLMLIILIPLTILLSCINIVTYDISIYKNQYDKLNISREIGIDNDELLIATQNLLDYIKDKRSNIDFKSIVEGKDVEFFSERDKLHMIDVKNIFLLIKILRNALLTFLLFSIIIIKFYKRIHINIEKVLIKAAVVGVLPFLLLILLISIDFNKYFTMFHLIFFNNDLWLLNPQVDRLVNIFPESFFSYMAIRILIYYFISMIIIFFIGFFKTLMKKKFSLDKKSGE